MLHLGSTYLITKNIKVSVEFYSKLLKMDPTERNYDRWVQFDFENNCIALYSEEYDKELISKNMDLKEHYNKEYLEWFKNRKISYGNNFVLNFWIEDLKAEYTRLKDINIGKVSEIMYVNIAVPYYFFLVEDPDGNTIEITGGYEYSY